MSARATVIIFVIIFSLGIFLIVVLPFVLGKKPEADDGGAADAEKTEEIQGRGIFRSDDGGRTWQPKSSAEGGGGSVASFKVNRLIPDPKDHRSLYLATDGNGLWLSRSQGDLWSKVNDGAGALQPGANVLALAVNPDNNKEWYVAVFQESRGRVLYTADSGRNFKEVYATPLERYGVFDVYYDRARGAVMIATGQGGLLESLNRGQTWRVARWFADGLIRLLVNPLKSDTRFVITPEGSIFRTEDRGKSWLDATPAIRGFGNATLNQRWFADEAGGIYLGSAYGLLRSRTDGSSFEAPPLIIPPDVLPVLAVAVDPRDAKHIAVAAASELYSSKDDGATWEVTAGPPGAERVNYLLIDAKSSEVIYAVTE